MTTPRFIHLHVHSEYSIIDGLAKINLLINKTSEFNMPALALTDFTNFYGLIKFYNTANTYGIKPIIGVDFLMENELLNNEISNLTILAKNNTGYYNLILLISHAYQKGYSITTGPTIKQNWLKKYNEGLLLLSGGCYGDIGKLLLKNNNKPLIKQCLKFYQTYFPNNYYLELTRTGLPNEEKYLQFAVELAKKTCCPIVATNNVRFIHKDDFNAHEIRVAIHDNFKLDDPKRPKKYSSQQYLRNEQEMVDLFSDIPEALENSVQIAKRCSVIIPLGKYFLPRFPTGNIKIEPFFIKCAKKGLENRLLCLYPNEKKRNIKRIKYDQRLDIELKVINKMKFSGYFLIVMEFIQWAKNNNIPVGPGRGSGAGSLVAYALNITDIDPLKFNLLFERFLNPERISMPDFDIDFCIQKRDQVIKHVINMYGYKSVSQIITFGTMTARAVIKDVGRVIGYQYDFINRISKLIPLDPNITLKQAFLVEPKLNTLYNNNKEIQYLINMAYKLENIIRYAGKHAGGIVIAPTKITDFAPLYYDSKGLNPLVQFDKNDIEYTGLVKFDFLGLKTLTMIQSTINTINITRIKNTLSPIDIKNISLNDKKSFMQLHKAETIGIFQLESRGMKDLIKKLIPDCFEDIIALIALFRPGPLQSKMVDNFIDRKHGREIISYPNKNWQHESLKSILESTYGIILYQEQVMQIAQVLAGYTLGKADILRIAMSKKKTKEMLKQRIIFKEGAIKQGIDSTLAMKIFDILEKFAAYGFNKSHSTAYALLSYQTLWLKSHYPAEFMVNVMTTEMNNQKKLVNLINECWRLGIKVLIPNINNGFYNFHINEKGEIMYGIGAIKDIGIHSIEAIIQSRETNGPFKNIYDFCTRINTKKINCRILRNLILSGACDDLGPHRAALYASINNALKTANQINKIKNTKQTDMFGILTTEKQLLQKSDINVPKWSKSVILQGERETLGVYLTDHPINNYISEIIHYTNGLRLKDAVPTKHKPTITVAGLILNFKIINNKYGKKIGICTLDDLSAHLNIILSSEMLEKYQYQFKIDTIVIVTGQIYFDDFNNGNKMYIQKIMNLTEAREKYVQSISILLMNEKINNQSLNNLYQIIEKYRSGNIPVNIFVQKKNIFIPLKLKKKWLVTPTDNFISEIQALIGNECIKLKFNKIGIL